MEVDQKRQRYHLGKGVKSRPMFERHIRAERRIDADMARRTHVDRVAVRRSLRDEPHADDAVRTATVIDDHLLPRFSESLVASMRPTRSMPRRRRADDEPYRLGGERRLRGVGAGSERQHEQAQDLALPVSRCSPDSVGITLDAAVHGYHGTRHVVCARRGKKGHNVRKLFRIAGNGHGDLPLSELAPRFLGGSRPTICSAHYAAGLNAVQGDAILSHVAG